MRYAAYGSNLHPHRLGQRVPSARLVDVAMVSGWQLKFHKQGMDGSAKCNIVAAESTVFFALYDMDEREKTLLDRAEGPGYGARDIDIPGCGCCFSYVACRDHVDDGLRPFSWYRELVVVGLEYHRAPPAYVDAVRAVDHVIDDSTRRHELHMKLVAEARRDS